MKLKKHMGLFKNKEFTPLQFDAPNFAKIYDAIDIQYKTNDSKFTIFGLSGIIFYSDKDKINECYKKMDSIISDIKSSFNNLKQTKKKLMCMLVLMMVEKAQ